MARRAFIAFVLALLAVDATVAQQQPPAPRTVFRSNTALVSVDVVVRDNAGTVVRGLTESDFEVLEDGKPQAIRSFAFEEVDNRPNGARAFELLGDAESHLTGNGRPTTTPAAAAAEHADHADSMPTPMSSDELAGRRLMVLLFDISSMQPEDVQRAVDSATKYVNEKMAPADLVAVASISSMLNVLTDFTSDRATVAAALGTLTSKEGTSTPPPDASTVATDEAESADATDTNDDATAMEMFNNDLRLRALKAVAETLAPIDQKKAILYFSAGLQRSGEDNQVELRAAINAAVRAHVSIYPVDARGLQAIVPGGDATHASGRGTQMFSGAGVAKQYSDLNASQDTLTSLASDTGGRAFLDTNDFGEAFARVQRDMSAYYLLGYASTNLAKDGRFRRIQVKVRKPGLHVEARAGYYADRDFAHTNRTDREAQLQEQLFSAVSATDLPVMASAGYFRLAADRYFVPLAVVVPGSAVPVPPEKDKDKLALDVLGLVSDEQGRPVGRIRQTLQLPPGSVGTLASHQILYQSGVTLPPGRFSLKVVVRENTSGLLGSYEAPVVVPELKQAPLKVSSIAFGTQLQTAASKSTPNPLVHDGEQLVPNVTHVVGRNQKMYFFYEVYDPASGSSSPDVRTSLAFYKGRVKVYETPMVERETIDDSSRHAAVFRLEVPASAFAPGVYTCQVNIIDATASRFAFPRLTVLLK
jgi:VWFA-related protein